MARKSPRSIKLDINVRCSKIYPINSIEKTIMNN